MNKEERENQKGLCIQRYIEYVRTFHIDPSRDEFTSFLKEKYPDMEDWTKIYKNVSTLRVEALEVDEDLVNEVLNDTELGTEDYAERVAEAIRTHRRFVVTTAVNGKAVDIDFYKAIKNYCNRKDAILLLLPSEDVKSSKRQFKWNFDPLFKDDYFIMKDTKLCEHLLLSGITVSAKQRNPLTGLRKITSEHNCSVIVTGTKQLRENVPTYNGHLPNSLSCPGAITLPNYDNDYLMCKRTSYLAELDHQLAAIIVELADGDVFHLRPIQNSKDGGEFTDLGYHYKADGSVVKANNTVFVEGDAHAGEHNIELLKSIVDVLSDKGITEVILHDICDAGSVSHHESDNYVKKSMRAIANTNKLLKDADNVTAYLNDLTILDNLSVTIVNSNHDNFIKRYVEEGRAFKERDFINVPLACELFAAVCNKQVDNPLEYLVKNNTNVKLNNPERVKWLKLDESYKKYGVECGFHGHLGANGAKGSLKTFEEALNNAVVGHAHTGAIRCKIFQVGTASNLQLDYNHGLSSWTHSCALIYENGTKQMIDFIPTKKGYKYKID